MSRGAQATTAKGQRGNSTVLSRAARDDTAMTLPRVGCAGGGRGGGAKEETNVLTSKASLPRRDQS